VRVRVRVCERERCVSERERERDAGARPYFVNMKKKLGEGGVILHL